jgi:subtilisin family serine protease
MGVAAIQLSGQKASFSNFGKHVDVSAPGVQLISTFPGSRDGEYARWSGTSFAAPLAAAEAALLASVVPRQPDVRRIVEETAKPIDQINPGFAGKLGKGRIDPLRALQSLNNSPARQPIDVHSQILLSRGPAGGSSFGKASVNVRADRQEFVVEAHMLDVRSTYRLLVDGKELSSAVSASLGSVRFVFGTEPGDSPLPPSINPVTRVGQVELRDSLNRVVLQGSFAAGTSDPNDGFVESEALLSSPLPGSSGGGSASIRIEALMDGTRREQLGVSAEGLVSGDVYRLIVDGIDAGSTMVRSGFLRLLFTSDGVGGQLLPPNLRPVTNIRHVELRDSRGNVSLQGDFTNVQSR